MMISEKMVSRTAKSLTREKYVLEKLNKQIQNFKEKEDSLKKELEAISEDLKEAKSREQEVKQLNINAKIQADEEIMKNKQEHNELTMLKEMKKSIQKELNRAVQDNLNAKYNLDYLKENRRTLESNYKALQETNSTLTNEKEDLNEELLKCKQDYDELMQMFEQKKSEDNQLKNLYKFHFN